MLASGDFYTGLVAEAYGKLKASDFDPEPYAAFVESVGEPALEIGCGDGNPLLALRRRGLDLEGVDSSADMLERCRHNADALGVTVTLHQQLMQELSLDRRFRSIYFAGPTFNLLPDDDAALETLRAIGTHLSEHGAALIPLWIPGPTPPEQLGVAREATGEDGALLRYTAVSEIFDEVARNRITRTRYERVTPAGSERIEREWLVHWYRLEQFQVLCSQADLHIAQVVDRDGRPADATATGFTVTVRRG